MECGRAIPIFSAVRACGMTPKREKYKGSFDVDRGRVCNTEAGNHTENSVSHSSTKKCMKGMARSC